MLKQAIKRYAPKKLLSLYFRVKRAYVDKRALKAVMKLAVQNRTFRTSISDDGYYPLVCYLASKYDSVFSDFKRNPIYNYILECTGEQEQYGYHMLKLIDDIPGFTPSPDDWKEFSRNDFYGNPRTYPVIFGDKTINISSTTIRYVKVLGDIISMFDSGSIKSIAEIGVGYGGQCRIILSRLPVEQYTLFDLPEVLGLSERYLQNFPECNGKVRYVDGGHIYINDEYDFFMSNYAFTELRREIQDMYMEKVIKKSKRGYITWNDFAEKWGGYSVDEFLDTIPGSSRIEIDYPGTCLVVWGNK